MGSRSGARRCIVAVVAALIFLPAPCVAQAQDLRGIQAREARNADERTIAYLGRFRAALVERFGADPLLSMMVFGEGEGTALVHAARGAPAQFVIFQEGKWLGTDGRQLKPWAPGADLAVALFPLSKVSDAFVRDRFSTHRKVASHATDFLGPVKVGYFGRPLDRRILEIQVMSLSGGGLSAAAFDLDTGAPVASR